MNTTKIFQICVNIQCKDSMTDTNFKNVVFLKFVLIYDALGESNLLFVDSDVVF